MSFRKKNWLEKNWLKLVNNPGYMDYKIAYKHSLEDQKLFELQQSNKQNICQDVYDIIEKEKSINFSHSGNAGDIIYSLPTLKRLFELTNTKISLFLKLNQPLTIPAHYKHPLGNVMLNSKMAEMLIELLKKQPYLHKCEILTDQKYFALDAFRAGLIPLDKGNIAKWCGYSICVSPELWKPWIHVDKNNSYSNKIILSRSERYRNKSIDFSFLNKYDDILFIGVKTEFEDIKNSIKNIKWVQVDNFLEMAQIIAGSKLFIGNQSFPFSIAEGLKTCRILETSQDVINVVPEGENGYDFFFQDHFEQLVAKIYSGEN